MITMQATNRLLVPMEILQDGESYTATDRELCVMSTLTGTTWKAAHSYTVEGKTYVEFEMSYRAYAYGGLMDIRMEFANLLRRATE